MNITTLTKENFDEEIRSAAGAVLVDFWAPWCGPCRMQAPIVEAFADHHPEIKVCKLNVDEQEEIATRFGIMSIPTLIAFRGGKVTNRFTGLSDEEKLEALCR